MRETEEEQRARLAYEASLRALDQQRRSLDEIRSRTGVLLAAASVSASFLGARAFEWHADLGLICLGLVALVTTLLLGILALTLDEDVMLALSGSAIDVGLSRARDRADQHRQLAYWLDGAWERNEASLERLNLRFRAMAGALAIQVVLWTVTLAVTVHASP